MLLKTLLLEACVAPSLGCGHVHYVSKLLTKMGHQNLTFRYQWVFTPYSLRNSFARDLVECTFWGGYCRIIWSFTSQLWFELFVNRSLEMHCHIKFSWRMNSSILHSTRSNSTLVKWFEVPFRELVLPSRCLNKLAVRAGWIPRRSIEYYSW